MGNDDLTIEILKSIRDELKSHGEKLDRANDRLDRMAHEQIRHATAIVSLEGRMGDLAEGQRAVVGELVKLNARFDNILGTVGAAGRDTAARVDKLEERCDAMEKRLG